jgi:quercetin dioxygenase-like cupin family protein
VAEDVGPSTSCGSGLATIPRSGVSFGRGTFARSTLDRRISNSTWHESWSSSIASPGGAAANAKTLVKYDDFRVVLTALKAHARLPGHQTEGRISIQTVAGHIQVRAHGRTFDLQTGRLLALDQGLPHDVEALEESAFLLTIVLLLLSVPLFWAVMATVGLAAAAFKMVKDVRGGKM